MFDVVRLDHFRGFVAYWQVHTSHRSARDGRWVRGPGKGLFNRLFRQYPARPVVAEDLGHITQNVRRLIDRLQVPSMRVLQFGFDGDLHVNPHWTKNHKPNCVVYTGTHDTNTIKGWFENEVDPAQEKNIFATLGHKVVSSQIHWELIQLAMSSVADLVIIPMQDVLGLGEEARMNRPGTTDGNWTWRLKPGQIRAPVIKKLRSLTRAYGRS
jgi:4-alpha-glucanotransferase